MDLLVFWLGPVLAAFLVGVGLYFTWIFRGVQWRVSRYVPNKLVEGGDVTPFGAWATFLGGIAVSNILGTVAAVMVGGAGAIVWMMVAVLIGGAIPWVETALAVRFRLVDERNEMLGGPMTYMQDGLRWRFVAWIYAVCGVIAAICIGSLIPAHTISRALSLHFDISPFLSGVTLAWVVALCIMGGVRSVARVARIAVPLLIAAYLFFALFVLSNFWEVVPQAVIDIVQAAFSGQAAVGGFLGATAMIAIRAGAVQGFYASQIGLGTAGILGAAAKTRCPMAQGKWMMGATYLATIVVGGITGLVLTVTEAMSLEEPSELSLLTYAFGSRAIVWLIAALATTSILAWSVVGERCLEHLTGSRSWFVYRLFFVLLLVSGALLRIDAAAPVAGVALWVMAFLNLLSLVLLSGTAVTESRLDQEKP